MARAKKLFPTLQGARGNDAGPVPRRLAHAVRGAWKNDPSVRDRCRTNHRFRSVAAGISSFPNTALTAIAQRRFAFELRHCVTRRARLAAVVTHPDGMPRAPRGHAPRLELPRRPVHIGWDRNRSHPNSSYRRLQASIDPGSGSTDQDRSHPDPSNRIHLHQASIVRHSTPLRWVSRRSSTTWQRDSSWR